MTDFSSILANLKRPGLLIRAARHGVTGYNRNRDLKRLLNGMAPAPHLALEALLAKEEELELARQNRATAYSPARHVDVLIAMMAELRLLRSADAV